MKIKSIEMYGYTRLRLNGNKYIKMTMTEINQVILGTNGCGKSSLLAELNPQPANPAFFDKDGYEVIEIENNDSLYILSSRFSQKKVHSFIADGVELNGGGTAAIQKELAKQHFNHTQEIHDLLIGVERFSAMGPAQRQKWITLLCPTNYDYAIKTYAKLKERARDTTGALKRARERLVAETAKAVSAEDEKRLSDEVNQIHRELNELQAHRAPLDNPVSFYKGRQDVLLRELSDMSMRLLDTRMSAPNADVRNPLQERDEWGQVHTPSFESISQIDSAIDRLKATVAGKEALLNKAVREHTRLSEALKTLLKTGEQGMTELHGRMKSARERKEEILGNRRLGLNGINGVAALTALNSVDDFMTNLLSTIPENADRRYSADNYEKVKDTVYKLKDKRTRSMTELQHMNAKRVHMEQHKASGTTSCPKCSHTWHAGYSESEYSSLLSIISSKDEAISLEDKEIVRLEEEAQENLNYGNEYRSFVRCTQGCPELNPFWDHLFSEGYITRSPRQALGVVQIFRNDLEYEIQAGKVDLEIAQIYDLIRLVEQTGDMNFSETSEQLNACTADIEKLTHELTLLRDAVTEHVRYRKQAIDMIDLSARINETRKDLSKTNSDMIEMMRRETLQLCIRQYQSALAQKEEILNYVVLQKALVEDLKEQINTLVQEEIACKELVKHLSPSEGLIAKGLLGFVRAFVGQMNELIRKIWTYPLKVVDCGTTGVHGTELDYKFPVIVQNQPKPIDDVKLGSNGQRDIIDLSFKVTAMNYLGMSNHPLMLDEFGQGFDDAHRNASSHVIKSLMEQRPFSQLFMISHYEQAYGALAQAEICVICANNVTLPHSLKYNQHVTLR